jgi:hypothetical protein
MKKIVNPFIFLIIFFGSFCKGSVFVSLNSELGGDAEIFKNSTASQTLYSAHLMEGLQTGLRNRSKTFSISLETLYGNWQTSAGSPSQTDFLYGLGFRIRRYASSTSSTSNFSDPGYWGSLGYETSLSKRIKLDIGARYSSTIFKASDNSSLGSDLTLSMWSLFASFNLVFGK